MTTPPPSGDEPTSIRERLRSPAGLGEQNAGGDSRHSDVATAEFQQTDSRQELLERGHATDQRGTPSGVAAPPLPPEQLDERAARAAERKVAALFLLSVVAVVGFFVTYWAVPWHYGHGGYQWFTPLLGLCIALALTGIGAGSVVWAKTLMLDEETVQERHPLPSDPEDRAATAAALRAGAEASGLPRRTLVRNTLLLGGGALAALPVPLVFGLGPYPHKEREMATTGWRKGVRLTRQDGTPVRLGDLAIGSAETVYPDVPGGTTRSDSPALLIRMRPEELHPVAGREDWSYEGHIVYSVICTHLGCPVKLYEQQTRHLFCPCHQSTFDASRGCHVLFGPAARPLPQLPIQVDADGYFVAQSDFREPIGPSYWERS